MASQNLPEPDYAKNMKLIGHSDQGGRPDGVQLMVNKGFAITGHMFSKGFSVIDVRDPRDPKPVTYVPAPANTWNIHLQTHGDLLLVINAKDMFAAAEFQDESQYYEGALGEKVGTADATRTVERDWTAGLAVYDIADPAEPRQIGFMPVDGGGVHRIWYVGG
ncbi:MAG: LVIVD repeat-containing protein, partial [Hyphomicrobiaceae bacterium]